MFFQEIRGFVENVSPIGIGLGFGDQNVRNSLKTTTFRTLKTTTFRHFWHFSKILVFQPNPHCFTVKAGQKRNPLLVKTGTPKTDTLDTTGPTTGPTLGQTLVLHWAYTGPTLGPTRAKTCPTRAKTCPTRAKTSKSQKCQKCLKFRVFDRNVRNV